MAYPPGTQPTNVTDGLSSGSGYHAGLHNGANAAINDIVTRLNSLITQVDAIQVSASWTGLSFASGYAAYPTFGHPPQYRKRGDSVEFRGTVSRTVSTTALASSATQFATMPTGFRPVRDFVYGVAASTSATTTRIELAADGTLKYLISGGSPTWFSLDGIVMVLDDTGSIA